MRNLQITQAITNSESQSMETYFKEIGKVQLISGEEEVILARKIKQGDQAALERLTTTNLRFVISVAKKYQRMGLPLADLISEGNVGLVKAAQRFDETRGFKFISFAVWWIRQSILAAIADHTRMVRLPLNQINLLTKMNRLSGDLEGQLERKPTDEELAELMDIPVEKIEDAHYFCGRTSSYDAPLGSDDEYKLIDQLAAEEQSIESSFLEDSPRQQISRLLNTLSPRERLLIELSFGLQGERPLLPRDIARVMGLSSERVRQIRNDAIKKLKDKTTEIA